jgi:hypothetical protein
MAADTNLMMAASIGVFLGVIVRTWFPYYWKKLQAAATAGGLQFKWEWRYLFTAMSALGGAWVLAFPIIQGLQAAGLPTDVTGMLGALAFGFVLGGGTNAILNAWIADFHPPTS